MDLFSNFNFLSLESSPRDELYEILNHYLDERSKIEEIRNIYIVANSIMEDKITILFPEHHDKDYSVKIDIFCERFGIDSEIKDTWKKIRTNRNIFAHGEQEYIDNKWIVTLDSGRRITLDKEKYIECLEDMAKIEEEIAIKCPDFNKKKFE